MNRQWISQWISRHALTVALAAAILLALQGGVDRLGKGYVDEAFSRALITFGIARGLNAVLSVAQGTEVAVQPAGVGINFAPGEILDPVNDLVERFSWVMLASSTALGIMKVLLEISAWYGTTLLLVVAGLLFIFAVRRWDGAPPGLGRTLRVFLLAALGLRFLVPLVAIVNESIYSLFLQPQYTESSHGLQQTTVELKAISDEQDGEAADETMFEKLRDVYDSAAQGLNVKARLERFTESAAASSENLIRLTVVFVLQTILFPLGLFWLISRLVGKLLPGS